jgi:hypothetical protein
MPPRKAATPKPRKKSRPHRTGGEWEIEAVFRNKDGKILEPTRFTGTYVESYISGDDRGRNMGQLLRGRMEEQFRKVGM